jgi:hypothetical protein
MHHVSQRAAALASCAFLLTFTPSLLADTLPPYSFTASTQYGVNTSTLGSYSDDNGIATGFSTVFGFGTPQPVVGASDSTQATPAGGTVPSDARAFLTYYFEVAGPAGNVQVDINSLAGVSASGTDPGFQQDYAVIADAKLTIPALSVSDETLIDFTDTGVSCCFPASTQDNGFNSSGTPGTGFAGFLGSESGTVQFGIQSRYWQYGQQRA